MSLDPQVRMIDLMKKAQPSMRYEAGTDFAAWQEKAREQLKQLLGLPLQDCPLNFTIDYVREEENYTETRFCFDSEPDVTVAAHLLVPRDAASGAASSDDGAEKKYSLVLALQGHATGMHISLGRPKSEYDADSIRGGRDFAIQAVARGQAALVMDQRGFGERGGTPEGPACHQPSVQALLMGKTIIGQRCHDTSRAIDVVEAYFPLIDTSHIVLMGNSGGGTTTIYEAALDTRIAAAMPSCALCGYLPSIGAQFHCLCNYVPNIMNYFDMGDLLGMIAPRPLVVVNGLKDTIFPIYSAKEQFELGRSLYEAAGAPENIAHVIGAQGHRFYPEDAWPVFDKLTHWNEI